MRRIQLAAGDFCLDAYLPHERFRAADGSTNRWHGYRKFCREQKRSLQLASSANYFSP
jgi:hypothetical protein